MQRSKAILGSALIAGFALGVSYYLLQALYLTFLLARAGRADTEPFQTAMFRHVALGISVAAAVVAFAMFYRRQVSSG